MVKPGYTDSRDSSTDLSALYTARAVLDDLAGGKSVSQDALDQAREIYVEFLWEKGSVADKTIRDGLLSLYEHEKDPAGKSFIIGELVAAGPRGTAVLEEIMRKESSTELTPEELRLLRELQDKPPAQRLEKIAALLEEEAKRNVPPEAPEPFGDDYPRDDRLILMPQREPIYIKEDTPIGGAPPELGGAENDLSNPNLPPEQRLQVAEELGTGAVPILSKMLLGNDPKEKEFAGVALIHLSKGSAKRLVHESMRRLEVQPQARRSAEHVRHQVENSGDAVDADMHARSRAKSGGNYDGWLRRAFSQCDAPSILKAAAGREVLAIPIGIRQIHEMRARK